MSKNINILNYITLLLSVMTIIITFVCYLQNLNYMFSYFFTIVTLIVYIINRIIIMKEKNLSNKDREMLEILKNKIKEGEKNG